MDDSRVRKAADVLSRILSPERVEGAERWMGFVRAWESLAGDRLAAHSRPVDLRKGAVVIEADHPGWIQLLQLRQGDILKRLKREYPELEIRSMAFRLAGSRDAPGYRGPDRKPDEETVEYADEVGWREPLERTGETDGSEGEGRAPMEEARSPAPYPSDFRSVLSSLEKTLKEGNRKPKE